MLQIHKKHNYDTYNRTIRDILTEYHCVFTCLRIQGWDQNSMIGLILDPFPIQKQNKNQSKIINICYYSIIGKM